MRFQSLVKSRVSTGWTGTHVGHVMVTRKSSLVNEALSRMYGENCRVCRAEEIETAEALSLKWVQGSMPKQPGTAAKAVLKVSENHPALIVRALSGLAVAAAIGEHLTPHG